MCASDENQHKNRKQMILDVSLLFGASGSLDEGLMNSFL